MFGSGEELTVGLGCECGGHCHCRDRDFGHQGVVEGDEGGFADNPSPSTQHTAGKRCSCHLDSLCRKVGQLGCAGGGCPLCCPVGVG